MTMDDECRFCEERPVMTLLIRNCLTPAISLRNSAIRVGGEVTIHREQIEIFILHEVQYCFMSTACIVPGFNAGYANSALRLKKARGRALTADRL
jgi:hypothetical protein